MAAGSLKSTHCLILNAFLACLSALSLDLRLTSAVSSLLARDTHLINLTCVQLLSSLLSYVDIESSELMLLLFYLIDRLSLNLFSDWLENIVLPIFVILKFFLNYLIY